MICPLLTLVVLVVAGPAGAGDGADLFEAKVRPVLVEHCLGCHSAAAGKSKGGLRLDTPDALRKGGDSGPLFVPGNPDGSLLLQAVGYAPDAPAMPPTGRLPAKAVADLRAWVRAGGVLPEGAAAASTAARPAADGKDHWAFRPAREQPAPAVPDPRWPARKLDHFVAARLAAAGMNPAPPADRRTLARRVALDLTGLPPTYEQVEAFAADPRPDSYARLVDGLLASPRFGEAWARHWLDVARYAEDQSTGESTCQPPRFPFRYRDWVIAALNADLPYDQFVRLQLAADRMPGAAPADLAALGFLGLSPVYHKEPKLSKEVIAGIVADEWDERLDAITRGFLGLTVACARCHDHKFDPVSQADYYALAGVLANTQLAERSLAPGGDGRAAELTGVRAAIFDTEQRLGYAKEMRATAVKEKQDSKPFERRAAALEAALKPLRDREKELPAADLANGVRDAGTWVGGADPAWTVVEYDPARPRDLPVFVRGDATRPGPSPVPRRFLPALSPGEPRPLRDGSGRRELAEAIVGEAGGLAARVLVNRVWGWVFARGLVGTPSNFGRLGDAPTHPELLDDLAARFIANGWSLKWLVREIVLSSTYRQSAEMRNAEYGMRNGEPSALAVVGGFAAVPRSEIRTPNSDDPDNRRLGRAPVRRLEPEQWRDAMLQASGRLDLRGGGPSDDLNDVKAVRRAVYGRVSRQRPADIHRLFDLPDPKAHGEKREPTITPTQQLYFLNSPFVRAAAAGVARRETVDETDDPGVVARGIYRRVLARNPTPAEAAAAESLARSPGADGRFQWELVAQALLVSNEFLFVR